MSSTLHGHAWTLRPFLRNRLRPVPAPKNDAPWRAALQDPVVGPVELSGRLSAGQGPALVMLVHGLGGSVDSPYMAHAALEVVDQGLDCLRLNLRGADRRGRDYYHAGLTADLQAALSDPALARYERVYLLGFSLGGHVLLRYLAERPDPRVRAAATICAPVDLAAGARAIDQPRRAPYRHHVLSGLIEIYRGVAQRRAVHLPPREAAKIRTIRAWDERIIAPRHGFAGAEDYWAKMNAGSTLHLIETPTLFVATVHDPMVPFETLSPAMRGTPALHPVRLERGGHVGFPPGIDLGIGQRGSVVGQTLRWMSSAGA